MRRVRFKHNKYSPGVLYILVILGVTLGLLAWSGFIMLSGLEEGPEYAPAYFRDHPTHAVCLIFALLPVFMLFPVWVAKKIWSHEAEDDSYIDLYEDYAVLHWNNTKVDIKKGELVIKIPKPQPFWYETYILKLPKRRIVLVSSVQENSQKGRRSLNIAIEELSAYKRKQRNYKGKRTSRKREPRT